MTENVLNEDGSTKAAPDADAVMQDPAVTFQQTIPNLPWEILLRSSGWFFQKTPGGGMILKLIPTVQINGVVQMMPPGIEVHFDADGWEAFKGDVGRDGVQSPIVTATRMPPAPR